MAAVTAISVTLPLLQDSRASNASQDSPYKSDIADAARAVDDYKIESAFLKWAFRRQAKLELSTGQRKQFQELIAELISKMDPETIISSELAPLREKIKVLELQAQHRTDALQAASQALKETASEAVRTEFSTLKSEVENLVNEIIWGDKDGPRARMANRIVANLKDAENDVNLFRGRLTRNATANLVYGVVCAYAGMAIALFGHNAIDVTNEAGSFMSINAIRLITIALAIEVLAFFFLRIYRSLLTDIRHVENELINLRNRSIALSASMGASESGDQSLLVEISRSLALADRNAVVATDMVIPTIERIKVDSAGDTEFLREIGKILKENRGSRRRAGASESTRDRS